MANSASKLLCITMLASMISGCATTSPVVSPQRQAMYNMVSALQGESGTNTAVPPSLNYATTSPNRTQASDDARRHSNRKPQDQSRIHSSQVRPVPPESTPRQFKSVSTTQRQPPQSQTVLQPQVEELPPPRQLSPRQQSQLQAQPQLVPYYDSVLPPHAALPMPTGGSQCDPTLPCVPQRQSQQPCIPQPCPTQPCIPQNCDPAPQIAQPCEPDRKRAQQIDDLLTRVTAMEHDLRTSKKTTNDLRHELNRANQQVVDLSKQVRQWQGRVHELELTMQDQHQRDIKALDRITRLLGSLVEMESSDQMIGARR